MPIPKGQMLRCIWQRFLNLFNKHACLKQTNKKSQQISRQSQQKKITFKGTKQIEILELKQHNYIFRSTSLVDPRINYLKESQDRIANWWVSAQVKVNSEPADGSPSQLLAHSFWCRYEAVIQGISTNHKNFLIPSGYSTGHYYRGHRWFGITGCKWGAPETGLYILKATYPNT